MYVTKPTHSLQSIKCAEIEVSLFNAGKKEEFMQQSDRYEYIIICAYSNSDY